MSLDTLTQEEIGKAITLVSQGTTVRALARELGLSRRSAGRLQAMVLAPLTGAPAQPPPAPPDAAAVPDVGPSDAGLDFTGAGVPRTAPALPPWELPKVPRRRRRARRTPESDAQYESDLREALRQARASDDAELESKLALTLRRFTQTRDSREASEAGSAAQFEAVPPHVRALLRELLTCCDGSSHSASDWIEIIEATAQALRTELATPAGDA